MSQYDVAIIGAGIAGASIASEIADQCSVVMLEAEDQPGYHSTGRSAAFWTETYGGPQVQPLTTASYQFLNDPKPAFSETSFLKKRRAINIARSDERHLVDAFIAEFAGSGVAMTPWTRKEIIEVMPNLKTNWDHAVYEPDCCDIDVAGLHMAYLRDVKRKGAALLCRARAEKITRKNAAWVIDTGGETVHAKQIINAAGAWAAEVATLAGALPIDIQPMRRTMVQLNTDPLSSPDMPLVVALDGSFYFKPEAGGSYWLSPHDETPVPAGDVAPEEWDVALAIDRFQSIMDVEIRSVNRKWAGLRSFAPDRLPIYGFDPQQQDFFWFAGQGGFGIQTAPAAAKLAKSIFLDAEREPSVQSLDAGLYGPARFAR
ncbi:NAD(P)/FAD-dependent oxidoreductase [Parasphingorhabdus cellanae]|uniref:FAD-binding oxidoreductase n=1 Tax=Parasphingorhabdus cellanae TaxID=2806553 RepID=A0ABX7T3K4_9SPHN|nr:FAD-dependent oxidoreductase [Parasphingorhabdus cellanae]QTD55533.1 FAD-binding oxidoreductase [Parasphingorhabdus cellanae]